MDRKRIYFRKRQRRRMLYAYIGFLVLLSVSIILMPIGLRLAEQNIPLSILAGILFWVGLAGIIAMAAIITHSRHHSRGFEKYYPHLKQLGIIHFFQNAPAKLCDTLMFLSLICFVIIRVWFNETLYPFVLLSILIFSFGMHCMLNGSNYIYINYQIRRVTEI